MNVADKCAASLIKALSRIALAALCCWAATQTLTAATLNVSVTRLDYIYNNGTPPLPKTFGITFSGGTAPWTATADKPWINISPSSGSGPATVQVSLNTTGLAPTSYSGRITITAPGATGSPKLVTVNLTIYSPSLKFSKKEVTVPIPPSGQASALIDISNIGGGQLNWTAASSNPWLQVSPTSGIAPSQLQLSANMAGYAKGTYRGNVTVTAPGASGSPGILAFTAVVTSTSSTLQVGPSSLTYSMTVGGAAPVSQSLNITNSPVVAASWTAQRSQNWIVLSASSGSVGSPLSISVNPAGLSAGTYQGNVQVTSSGLTGSPATIPITFTINPAPTLHVSPSSLTFSTTLGDPAPASQALNITNSPVTPGSWTAQATQSWIELSANGGSMGSPVSVSVNPTGLSAGTYQGNVQIASVGLTGSPATIPVTFTVNPPPTLQVGPSSLTFSMTLGDPAPTSQPLSITNSPVTPGSWTAQGSQNWIVLSAGAGGIGSPTSVSVNPAGLSVGTHQGNVQVTSAGLTGSPATIPVTFTINAAPSLQVSPSSLTFSMTLGGAAPVSQPLSITNSPVTPGSWTAQGDQSWIVLSANGGSVGSPVSISVNPAGLDVGTHQGNVQVTSVGLTGSPATIPVTFTIHADPTLQVSPPSLTFSMTLGGPAPDSQPLSIANSTATAASWTAQSDRSWIVLSAAAGSMPSSAPLSISINPAGLGAGTHQGSVQVTSAGLTGSPAIIPVTFSINPAAPTGSDFYVSPTGSPAGSGSVDSPWDLATALAHPAAVRPGDTIWLRNGEYQGIFTSRLVGAIDNAITVRQYPGERATINSGTRSGVAALIANGSDTWFWGFEIMSSNPNRYTPIPGSGLLTDRAGGIQANGVRNKYINLVIHDTAQGVAMWTPAVDSELYGSLIYYNGWNAPDRGHGHALYSQNQDGIQLIRDNISHNGFGMGFHSYGSNLAHVEDIHFFGNVAFNAGYLAGGPIGHWSNYLVTGGAGASGIVFNDNHSYHNTNDRTGSSQLGWIWSGVEQDLVAQNNYFIGGLSAIEVWNWNQVTFTGNTVYDKSDLVAILNTTGTQSAASYLFDQNRYYGRNLFRYQGANMPFASWQSAAHVDANSQHSLGRPTGVWTFVRPNLYESGRANIIVYNWNLGSHISVDVSAVLTVGQEYVLQDSLNFYGPAVASGIYDGSPLSIPMTGLTVAPPVGTNVPFQPVHTAPEFGVFILLGK